MVYTPVFRVIRHNSSVSSTQDRTDEYIVGSTFARVQTYDICRALCPSKYTEDERPNPLDKYHKFDFIETQNGESIYKYTVFEPYCG